MKKLLSLLLACTLLCGCAQTNTPADVTTTTPDNVAEESGNKYEKYDFSAISEEIKYNSNPDNSGKVSQAPSFDAAVPKDFASVIEKAYDIAIIRVVEQEESIIDKFLNEEQEKIMLEAGDKIDPIIVDVYKSEVMFSLCGNHNIGDEISVSKYVEGVGVTLETGKEYLIITQEFEKDGKIYYPPLVGQIGIFNINDDFTVTSQSSKYTAAKYDGLSLADVAHDLKTKFDEAKSE